MKLIQKIKVDTVSDDPQQTLGNNDPNNRSENAAEECMSPVQESEKPVSEQGQSSEESSGMYDLNDNGVNM